MYTHVQNGTGGFSRRVYEQIKRDWKCPSCRAWIRYFWASCPNCAHPRTHEE